MPLSVWKCTYKDVFMVVCMSQGVGMSKGVCICGRCEYICLCVHEDFVCALRECHVRVYVRSVCVFVREMIVCQGTDRVRPIVENDLHY